MKFYGYIKNFSLISAIYILLSYSHASELFINHDLIEMNLTGHFHDSWQQRNKQLIKGHEAKIIFNNQIINIQMKARGYKRLLSYQGKNGEKEFFCNFPLLKIEGLYESDIFEIGEKYYFTSHCNDNELREEVPKGLLLGGNNSLLKEYLGYRIQKIITDFSAPVRLVKMTYIDLNAKYPNITRYGFFVKDFSKVAKGMDSLFVEEDETIITSRLNPKFLVRQELFQFLIGNHDRSFSGRHRHNYASFRNIKTKDILLMAFDFNQTGLTNYSNSNDEFHINILCSISTDLIIDEINILLNKKKSVVDFLNEFKLLNQKDLKFATQYINDRFDKLSKVTTINNLKPLVVNSEFCRYKL